MRNQDLVWGAVLGAVVGGAGAALSHSAIGTGTDFWFWMAGGVVVGAVLGIVAPWLVFFFDIL